MPNFQLLICLLCLFIWKNSLQVSGLSIPVTNSRQQQQQNHHPSILQNSNSLPENKNNFLGHSLEKSNEFSRITKPEQSYADGLNNNIVEDGFHDTGIEEFGNYFPNLSPSTFVDIYSKGSDDSKVPKQLAPIRTTRIKRSPTGFTARGFHEGAFDRDFGHFSPVKKSEKRRPEADSSGFYGDTFSNGFGQFETMKREPGRFRIDGGEFGEILKRKPMGASGFHGDTFSNGFGDFDTMKRHYPYPNWADKIKKSQEMTKSGFYGDTFNGGFGEFNPMKK